MYRRGLVFRLIVLLLVLALLAAGGSLLFRSGYSQGFVAGSLAAGAEGSTELFRALPYGLAPYGWPGHGYGFSPFGPILGLLFFGGLILLFFSLFSRPFYRDHGPFSRWRGEGGPHWNPEAWEEHMKAWRKAHEAAQGETPEEADRASSEAQSE